MPASALPLAGVRVLDIATFIAAPYCATILGEFGAEVIKIEQPGAGDPFRKFGTPSDRSDSSLAWLSEARSKKSITLDLRTPDGAGLFKRLVAMSDVVCENFRPGTLEKWGIGWDDLKAVNPDLIMLRVTGYGQTGPYKDRPGFARIAHAVGGLTNLAGMPGETPVTPGSTSLGDYLAGLYGTVGVLVALLHRRDGGGGQYIDLGLYEAVFRVLDEVAPAYAREGIIRESEGAGTRNACPHGHFPTQDGKWVAIACTTDKMFARFADVMNQPELAAPERYGPQEKRLAAQDDVIRLVSAWTAARTRDQVMDACLAGGVPAGPLNTIEDIFADPHFKARDDMETIDDPALGPVVIPGVFPKLSETPGRISNLGPPLGNANTEIYRGLLGLSEPELERLRRTGAI